MKPLQQYFYTVLFGLYVVLSCEPVDEILWRNHSNETSPAVLLHGTIWFVCQVVLSCNPVRLWCYHGNETSSAVLSHGTIFFVCSSDFWACGSGGTRGGALGARAPPLFFDQNDARRTEKKNCGDWPPLISGSGWPLSPPPPQSKGLDPPLGGWNLSSSTFTQ